MTIVNQAKEEFTNYRNITIFAIIFVIVIHDAYRVTTSKKNIPLASFTVHELAPLILCWLVSVRKGVQNELMFNASRGYQKHHSGDFLGSHRENFSVFQDDR